MNFTMSHLKTIELNTPRLLLRQWQKNDYPLFAEMNSNPRVMKYFPDTLNKKQSDEFAGKLSQHLSENGWGLWVLEEKESKHFMGFTGLHKTPDDLPFSPAIEIGWRLSDKYWGKGYATEAAKEVLKYAFSVLHLEEIVSFTSVINKKSIAVMNRINMLDTKHNFMHPKIVDNNPLKEHVLYKIKKKDWLKNSSPLDMLL